MRCYVDWKVCFGVTQILARTNVEPHWSELFHFGFSGLKKFLESFRRSYPELKLRLGLCWQGRSCENILEYVNVESSNVAFLKVLFVFGAAVVVIRR